MAVPTQSSPFAAILSAVLDRLASKLGLDPAFVVPVASDDYVLDAIEDFFLRVRVYKPRPVNPSTGGDLIDQGAGRLATDVSRFFRIYVYTREGVDPAGTDNVALGGSDPTAIFSDTPTVPGQFLREEQVLNALLNFAPVVDDVCLSVGPVRWTTDNDAPERKPEDGEGVVRSCLDFEVVYKLSIDTTDPAA